MKIYIDFDFKNGANGGGNQFLSSIKSLLISKGLYAPSKSDTDVLIINGHHNLLKALFVKIFNSKIKILHRLDGFVELSRPEGRWIDKRVTYFANYIADGVVLQSNWVKHNLIKMNCLPLNHVVIVNSANPCFYSEDKKSLTPDKKIKIVSTSWSNNINKGFDHYKYLDEVLDFDMFDFTLIGNSPFLFKNIKTIPALDPISLSNELKKYDVFLFASKNDACSNSLVEGISCGLLPFALNSGGNPELVGNNKFLFNNKEELLCLLHKLKEDPLSFSYTRSMPRLENTLQLYLNFCEQIILLPNKALKAHIFIYYLFLYYISLFFEKTERKYVKVIKKYSA